MAGIREEPKATDEEKVAEIPYACPHGPDGQEDPHYCPYQNDINGNGDEEFCTCCEGCTDACAMEI